MIVGHVLANVTTIPFPEPPTAVAQVCGVFKDESPSTCSPALKKSSLMNVHRWSLDLPILNCIHDTTTTQGRKQIQRYEFTFADSQTSWCSAPESTGKRRPCRNPNRKSMQGLTISTDTHHRFARFHIFDEERVYPFNCTSSDRAKRCGGSAGADQDFELARLFSQAIYILGGVPVTDKIEREARRLRMSIMAAVVRWACSTLELSARRGFVEECVGEYMLARRAEEDDMCGKIRSGGIVKQVARVVTGTFTVVAASGRRNR